jgi:hypothetical protein
VPFTLVHPAAVVPIARKPLVVAALVAGAIAPDLLYLQPIYRAAVSVNGDFTLTLTHSFHAVLWVDPLLALAMLLVWYAVLRRPLLALAPASFTGRLAPTGGLRAWASPRYLAWTVVSAVIGAATHVLWDAVTHGDIVGLDAQVGGMSVYRLLQYVSTAVGAVYLAWWLRRWWRRTAVRPVPAGESLSRRARWGVLGALVALAVTVAVIELLTVGLPGLEETGVIEYPLRSLLVGASTGLVLGVAAYVLVWHGAGNRRRRSRQPG